MILDSRTQDSVKRTQDSVRRTQDLDRRTQDSDSRTQDSVNRTQASVVRTQDLFRMGDAVLKYAMRCRGTSLIRKRRPPRTIIWP